MLVENDALGYEEMKRLAKDEDADARARLAARTDLRPELLYYLASDESAKVRRAVAGNPATPVQANQSLAMDPDYGARCHLAAKMGGGGLTEAQRAKLWRMGTTILETLAHDQIAKVRRALAQAFKSAADAPHKVIRDLACDRDPQVAIPILESSPVLNESDLVEILFDGAPDWAQSAIARRETVTTAVSEAVVATQSEAAITELIANDGAEFNERTEAHILQLAPDVKAWHGPLAHRRSLSPEAVTRLEGFVDASLLEVSGAGSDIGPKASRMSGGDAAQPSAGLSGAFNPGSDEAGAPDPAEPQMPQRIYRGEFVDAQALFRFENGTLDQQAVAEAVDQGERGFATTALALAAGLPHSTAQAILSSGSAKSVTALVWKAGYSMRFAIDVQRWLAHIPPASILNARDGTDFPLSLEEMAQQLALFD